MMKVTVAPFPLHHEDGTEHHDDGDHHDLVVHFVPCLNIRGHEDVPITDLTVEDVAQMTPEERDNYHDLMTNYDLSDYCPGGPPQHQHEGEELERLNIQGSNNNNNNMANSLITAAEAVKEPDEATNVGDHVAEHEDGHWRLLLSQWMGGSPPPPPPLPPTTTPPPTRPPPLVVDLCSARVQDDAHVYREFFAALDELQLDI